MKKEIFVVGIDGGGTKTEAELCNARGKVLARGNAGPSNFQIIGVEEASETIVRLIQSVCRKAGIPTSALSLVVAGLTGAGRGSDQKRMVRGIRKNASAKRVRLPRVVVEGDATTALEGAFGGEVGVIVIVGTGSIVFGKDERGKIFRAGGWGRIIEDEGSGYAIGRAALQAVARSLDRGEHSTTLSRMIASRFGLKDQPSIIRAIYGKGFDVAALAPHVIEAAEKHDSTAFRILQTSCKNLTETIHGMLNRMKKEGKLPDDVPLAFVGSLGSTESIYLRILKRAISSRFPHIHIRQPKFPPVHGASLLALSILNR
ncbi:MAG TPA: BadF/BadG/BcrA/BcrD ATPase family protein [Bacteroidota bacterium]|nr:BadF/BadG/BcrA/BcrD ATPase family protein [Bacteroidota bacterium]